ncbi:spermidine synthase [Gynuella sp.]|uniref:spermidine synthase n=1 Tax=Gynuella sp. TaxID=2969146 RepID=UPI003D0D8269
MAKFGKEILRRHDGYGAIQIFDNGNKRTLMFGADDEQGCILNRTPEIVQYDYVRAMLLSLLFQKDVHRCLLLGMGTGALATTLWHHLEQLKIDVVELRQAVIDLAYSHFYLPHDERLKVQCRDAGDYLKHSTATYDLICSDIYHATGMDAQQGTRKFIKRCSDHLTNDGWLVLNYWQQHKKLDLIALLQQRFRHIWTNNINKENWIIYATNSAITITEKQRKVELKRVNNLFGFSLAKVNKGMKLYAPD